MHLLLIRHGETEHNVAGLLAGVTDSRLTNHGVLQTQRLGKFLTTNRKLHFTQIFTSDLQRAWVTGDEVRKSQQDEYGSSKAVTEVIKLELLREQDFGSLELVPWASKRDDDPLTVKVPSDTDPDFRPKETKEQMRKRADTFLDDYLSPLLAVDSIEETIAVVSHGLFLSALWRALLTRFKTSSITLGPEIGPQSPGRPLEYIGAWSNTGYLELEISNQKQELPSDEGMPSVPEYKDFSLKVLAINRRDHLSNLKRTRGVGSATHDPRQQSIAGFFKRPKT